MVRTRRRSWAMAAVALTLLAVTALGCSAPEQGANDKIAIGFLVKQPEELWFQNEWKFAQQCADKYGIELKKIGVPDGEKLLSAIDVLAASGAGGFVVCTPDVKLGPAVMAKAGAHGTAPMARSWTCRTWGYRPMPSDDKWARHCTKSSRAAAGPSTKPPPAPSPSTS